MTKINIETGIVSDRIGSENPVPAFQSCIACGQNLMSEHPVTSFFLKTLQLLIFVNILAKIVCKQSVTSIKSPMVQEFWQDLQGLFAPFTLNFAM
ncbi:hypothetical protein [Phocaeicola sp.]|uniref:hypothetical protein n=1 Tax=Phocaeicola sp. TaxID=2773926 RepID=UPI003F9F7423